MPDTGWLNDVWTAEENRRLDYEMAFARQRCFSESCDDPYDAHTECRRVSGHEGQHAAGFGTQRKFW